MDGVGQIANLVTEFYGWAKILVIPCGILTLSIGGFQQMFGGAEGVRKAKPWYIGTGVGVAIVILAGILVPFLQSRIAF